MNEGHAAPLVKGNACDIGAFEYGDIGIVPAYLLPVQGAREYIFNFSPSRLSPTAVILDADGNPVPGVLITFTAPSSGPSGTFNNGANTIDVMTGNNGLAAPGAFVANRTEGSYTLSGNCQGPCSPGVLRNEWQSEYQDLHHESEGGPEQAAWDVIVRTYLARMHRQRKSGGRLGRVVCLWHLFVL